MKTYHKKCVLFPVVHFVVGYWDVHGYCLRLFDLLTTVKLLSTFKTSVSSLSQGAAILNFCV